MRIFHNNVSVCFIGDSNISNGFFLDYLRSAFMAKNNKISLYNMGVAGNSVCNVEPLLNEELEYIKPDYAFIMFGVNDLGVWLYDGKKNIDDTLLGERNERIEIYSKGLKAVADALEKRGIIPVITSPLCVNENIVELKNIETVADNREKADYIDADFYTKQTFKNINLGLKVLSKRAKTFADSHGYEYFDLFDATLRLSDEKTFEKDGIHYTKHGHKILASVLLDMSGCFGYDLNNLNKKVLDIRQDEQDERFFYFIKYIIMADYVGKLTNAELVEKVKNLINEKGLMEGVTKDKLCGFYKYVSDARSRKLALFEKITLLND